MKRKILVLAMSVMAAAAVRASDNMKAFPPAEAGMARHVLKLPEEKDESILKVELIVGKTVKLDAGNRYFFGGSIASENIEGWGFTRYILKELGPMAGTLMAVDPQEPKVERFISLGGEPFLIRYNSRLPVVVYVPEGAEVRYRVWRADPKPKVVPKG